MNGGRFSVDPPEEDGHDPDRCDCGRHLTEYVGPDGETERICPECDADMASLAPPDPGPYGPHVAPSLEPGACPRCGGRQLADGVCASDECDANHLNRGWRLDRY